ncbi:hypothetical protein V1478_016989 [Vespula squamosa]|uniref:Uncharacterized protein n=1 Tax=Vespula squamosa TaxID=30214 RepID=A0ABD1ZY51_VESSQ
MQEFLIVNILCSSTCITNYSTGIVRYVLTLPMTCISTFPLPFANIPKFLFALLPSIKRNTRRVNSKVPQTLLKYQDRNEVLKEDKNKVTNNRESSISRRVVGRRSQYDDRAYKGSLLLLFAAAAAVAGAGADRADERVIRAKFVKDRFNAVHIILINFYIEIRTQIENNSLTTTISEKEMHGTESWNAMVCTWILKDRRMGECEDGGGVGVEWGWSGERGKWGEEGVGGGGGGYARPSCKLLHTTKKDPDSLRYGSSTNTRSKTLMSAFPNVLVETRVPSALRPRYDRDVGCDGVSDDDSSSSSSSSSNDSSSDGGGNGGSGGSPSLIVSLFKKTPSSVKS